MHLKIEFLKLTFLVRKQAGKNRIKATAAEDLKMAGRAKVEQSEIPKQECTPKRSVQDLQVCGYRRRDLPLLTLRVTLRAPHTRVCHHGPRSQPSERKRHLWAGNQLASSDVPSRANWTAQKGLLPAQLQGVSRLAAVCICSPSLGFPISAFWSWREPLKGQERGRDGEHGCPGTDFWLDASFPSRPGGRGPRKTNHCTGRERSWLLATDCLLELTVWPADRHK